MQEKRMVPFKISSLDSLGQGVSKESSKITFIPKTTVGDEGEAEIVAEKKGVAFARVKSYSSQSANRIESVCPHFNVCPSCHYLHVDYEDELAFKKINLEKLFFKVSHPEIKVIPAIRRLGYRNRIQLHYDLKSKTLGMFDVQRGAIAPIPNCLIGLAPIQDEVKRLYHQEQWLKEAPDSVTRGHVEIYWRENSLKVSWNQPYAEGGFTQVFEEMNQLMKQELLVWDASLKPGQELVDLFAGNGNISSGMNYSKRLCVDIYPQKMGEEFLSQDLYAASAQAIVMKNLKQRSISPSKMVIDPPRSGMKDLHAWLDEIRPEAVAYVSCDPHTLVRDLAQLKGYSVSGLNLIDFFPSTYHFETLTFLERK